MPDYQYSVVMQTPIGKKYGTLKASISENFISGWLDMLKHRQPFEGTIDNSGNCMISGTLITLMRTVSFIATGTLTASSVNLHMQGERNIFELSGVPCVKGGDT